MFRVPACLSQQVLLPVWPFHLCQQSLPSGVSHARPGQPVAFVLHLPTLLQYPLPK